MKHNIFIIVYASQSGKKSANTFACISFVLFVHVSHLFIYLFFACISSGLFFYSYFIDLPRIFE